MSFETLLPCPFCGGDPEEDAGGCIEYHGHEHQEYSITCKQCGAEVYCSVGAFEKADVPCSCHHDTRKVCVDKWNKRSATLQVQYEDDDGEPTDDERIMAIEGIHNCEQCGDEGWVVDEMGIMRFAWGQAGTLINEGTIQAGNSTVITGAEQCIADAVELLQKAAPAMLADNSGPDGPLAGRLKSPVIPEGYVMVPKEPTDEMIAAAMNCEDVLFNGDDSFCVQFGNIYEAMLAAAPQSPGSEPATVPDKWIPVSEQPPRIGARVLISDIERSGVYEALRFDGNRFNHFGCEIIANYWMPLPAAPKQENI